MLKLCNRNITYQICKCYFSINPGKVKNHYDTLQITPKATQNDIKSAYYKLSMVYHPDKHTNINNQKSNLEAATKFREITEAYEVLGNYRLRKLYDKGILYRPDFSGSSTTEDTDEPIDNESKFYKSREHRARPPPPPGFSSGRQAIYDFDEWTRAHYGQTFNRRIKAKDEFLRQKSREQDNKSDQIRYKMLCVFMGIFTIVFMVILDFLPRKYDRNLIKVKK